MVPRPGRQFARRSTDLVAGLPYWLALLHGPGAGEVLEVLEHQVGPALEQCGALAASPRRRNRPAADDLAGRGVVERNSVDWLSMTVR
jgi:hypothetical protein